MKLMRKNGGFTLVELIVVIAILAILAGIAVPAYSGYINKANEAADNQLLGAINTAFASACIENNMHPSEIDNASLDLNDRSVVPSSLQPAELATAFAAYYGTNTSAKFKVFTALDYVDGNFVGLRDAVKVTMNGQSFYVSKSKMDLLTNSTFGQKITADGLLDKVGLISGMATSMAGLTNADTGIAVNALGKVIYGTSGDADERQNAQIAYLDQLAKNMGMTGVEELMEKAQDDENYDMNKFLGNSLILSAAQNTQGMDTSFLTNEEGFVNDLKAELNSGDTNKALSQAALAYAMYNSYAHATNDTDALNSLKNAEEKGEIGDMISMLNDMEGKDSKFQQYLATEQGKSDLNAYLASMEVISDSASSSHDNAVDILVNGFDSENLSGVLGTLMGGSGE